MTLITSLWKAGWPRLRQSKLNALSRAARTAAATGSQRESGKILIWAEITSTRSLRTAIWNGWYGSPLTLQRQHEVGVKIGGQVDRDVTSACDGHMHEIVLSVGNADGAGLADPRERPRKIGVVLHRDEAVEREDGQRGVASRLVAAVAVRSAARAKRIGDGVDVERARLEQTDLSGVHIARLADAVAVNRRDVTGAGRQPGALRAVAETHGSRVIVGGLRDVVPGLGPKRGKRVGFVPLHVIDVNGQRGAVPSGLDAATKVTAFASA